MPPATWDEVFGDLDARSVSADDRLQFINRHIEIAVGDRGWSARGGGHEAEWVWADAVRAFVDGLWVACILCCHAVCEREVAGTIAMSLANLNGEIDKRWESFGLGRLLNEVERTELLPPGHIAELRVIADARKPYGHWRAAGHDDSLFQRVQREQLATGNDDAINLMERLVVRDATASILTTIKVFYGSFVLGG